MPPSTFHSEVNSTDYCEDQLTEHQPLLKIVSRNYCILFNYYHTNQDITIQIQQEHTNIGPYISFRYLQQYHFTYTTKTL
jgi:hypothetical protein